MLDIMYEVPSRDDVKTITITKEMVEKKQSQLAEIIQLPDKKPKTESA